jgi:MFS transporter, OPA family, sugar phosphate sensor protein UhpC
MEDERQLRQWRMKVFSSTWLTYAGFYFCRKAFYAVKGDLSTDLGIDETMLGYIGFVYLATYTIGQFSTAAMGRTFGPRRLLLIGMAVSALTNVVFGFATNAWTLMAFMAVNGFAQATGWPSCVGVMANWTRRKERGTIMGIWATCYQFGGVFATWWASLWLALQGWRGSFFAASVVLVLVWFYVYKMLRENPEDVGLPALEEEENSPESEAVSGEEQSVPESQDKGSLFGPGVLTTVLLVGLFYFWVKFVRYSLWSWAPYLLQTQFGFSGEEAGVMSTLFDFFGFLGAMTAGFMSDRLFRGRRTSISLIMLVGMVLGCCLLYMAGSMVPTDAEGAEAAMQSAKVMCGIGLATVGFMLFGPDSLLTGAGAMDLGSRRSALAAAGIINGMGSVGSMAQELVLPKVMQLTKDGVDLGWIQLASTDSVFLVLIFASVFSIGPLLVVGWRNRRGLSDL